MYYYVTCYVHIAEFKETAQVTPLLTYSYYKKVIDYGEDWSDSICELIRLKRCCWGVKYTGESVSHTKSRKFELSFTKTRTKGPQTAGRTQGRSIADWLKKGGVFRMETSDTLVLVSAPSVCPCRLSRLLR